MLQRIILTSLLFLLCVQPGCTQVGLFIRPNSSSLTSPVQGQTWLFNSTNNTMQVYNGSIFQTASAPQNNFSATVAPTTANDNTQGYSAASEWYNTTNGNVYSCVSAVTSAAVWIQINNLGSLSIPLTALQAGGAANRQSLLFNGTNWVPGNPLVSLNNVTQTGALTGQVPSWNGTNWVPTSLTAIAGAPASLSYVTVANETSNLPNSSQLLAGTGISLTNGTNTETIASTVTGLPSTTGLDQNNLLYVNSSNVVTWMGNHSLSPGGILCLNNVDIPTWGSVPTNLTAYGFPYLTNSTSALSYTAGLIGAVNDAGSPITGASQAYNPALGSLMVVNPDGSSGTTITLDDIGLPNKGMVLAIKNIGATYNVTVSLSGMHFTTPSGSTSQAITPGQCLLMMAQPYSSGSTVVWIIISLM